MKSVCAETGKEGTLMWTEEIRQHLTGTIIPFWKGLRDEENGGYYGYKGFDLTVDPKAVKGCILNSRILWFFSNAFLLLKDRELLSYAAHAWEFLKDHCIDPDNGGIYWSVGWNGQPEETIKHTYNQAFAIYALSSYYDASGNQEALDLAEKLFHLIENRCKDEGGYEEAFDREFHRIDNEKLSENGVMAERTMNTLLHVFEAYTELYRVGKKKEVAEKLQEILTVFADKVYNPQKRRQEVFFDRNWNSLIDLYSYGHDIETAWLIDRGCQILGDEALRNEMGIITREMTASVYEHGFSENSLMNECERGINDTTRVWWVQAEAIVGFFNGYQKETEKACYLEAAKAIWDYIKCFMVDPRPGSEWYWAVDEKGKPLEKPIVEPWKCPYHNGRMCMEIIRRTEDASQTVLY